MCVYVRMYVQIRKGKKGVRVEGNGLKGKDEGKGKVEGK